MGAKNEKKEEEKYFYKYFDNYSIVKLQPRLKNVHGSHTCQIKLIINSDWPEKKSLNKEEDNSKNPKSGGQTEEQTVNTTTNMINFQKYFVMEYFFEKVQQIEFVITGTINGIIKTSLPNILGAKNHTLNKRIEGTNGIILEVKGSPNKSRISSTLNIYLGINGNLKEKELMYTIKTKGDNNNSQNNLLYKSEINTPPKNIKNICFKKCIIPDIYICSDGNYDKSLIQIEIYDVKHNKKLGEYSGPLKSLINNNTSINLDKVGTGNIFIDTIKNYSFLDYYLNRGMNINLSMAIDFTGSNGSPNNLNSLHYLGPNPNQYEIAIKACWNIIQYYDYNQKIPAFGFGGKFYGMEIVDHCFPLNCNQESPEINGIDGLLEIYRDVLKNTKLFGPTFFHYVIDRLNSQIREDMAKENYNDYNILMILTDGIIEDIDETIDSLVESSYLPISIIIIGIGNADFNYFESINVDKMILDMDGKNIDRNLIQFIPFKNFKNNIQKLGEEMFTKIQNQIVEYYQSKQIFPEEFI